MKYMGSKRVMLNNSLGEMLRTESAKCGRLVDLFSGSASVSWFAAQEFEKPVLAIDLQRYARVLARAVIERLKPLDHDSLCKNWVKSIRLERKRFKIWQKASDLDGDGINTATWSRRAQDLCFEFNDAAGPIWEAYGGYYFSPTQSLTFDTLIECLPLNSSEKAVCLAATIIAASKCAASPGHTAQPFKASKTAGPYLREAWLRDPLYYVAESLRDLCSRHAKQKGKAVSGNANTVAETLNCNDLVFIDPPYSGVHYSRFYHVLETIARGRCGTVEGNGRYPPLKERPVSSYSRPSESRQAIEELFQSLANVGCTSIVTFPAGECSNGLSGSIVERLARKHFAVTRKTVKTRFSTLGGNNNLRSARQLSREMILLLRPL